LPLLFWESCSPSQKKGISFGPYDPAKEKKFLIKTSGAKGREGGKEVGNPPLRKRGGGKIVSGVEGGGVCDE